MKLSYFSVISLMLVMFLTPSCVKDEIYNGPASIDKASILPEAPKSTDDVIVSAQVTDLKGITSVTLFYKTAASATFQPLEMTKGDGSLFSATIPALALNTKVEYYIEAKNVGGFQTLSPAEAPAKLASYTVGVSSVVKIFINEAFSDGTKDATDPDWAEIYNASDIPVDLSGYAFYDEGIKSSAGVKPKRILNAGTIIPAKGFLVLKTENTGGEYAVEFGLGSSGDAVYLENTAGVLVSSLDFLTISLSGKKSYGRQPDGSTNLVVFTAPTKGTSNN
ncbi:lamin tail domain-containing protein [Pedobacter arcticus]|uniref:lamin tail domain-containing protein n=1 Tax=Pedobacter arcticus TaxID=752140 RepID=UPI0002E494E9|nr:lamin tail domain-containing protein [Pedobacter arcticus]